MVLRNIVACSSYHVYRVPGIFGLRMLYSLLDLSAHMLCPSVCTLIQASDEAVQLEHSVSEHSQYTQPCGPSEDTSCNSVVYR